LRQDYVKSKNAEQEVRVSQRASKQERERLQTSLEEARASERRLLGQVDTLAEEGDRWRREHETTHGELRKTQTRLQALGDTMGRLRDMLAESQQNAVAVRKMRDEIQRLGGDLGASQRTLHALQVDRERMQALFRTASEEVQSLERELDAARSANVTAAKAIEDVIRSTRGEQAGAKMITSKLELVERHVGFCFFVFLFFVCPFLI
jgi:chromosome segregation ATPase